MAIAQNFPEIAPSLNLSFALTKALDPRVTFARASTGAYYGTQTAKAEENLFIRSQEFDNAVWTKTGVAVTANTTAAPDGTTTAETVTATAGSSQHHVQASGSILVPVVIGTTYTFSIHIKQGTYQYVQLTVGNAPEFGVNAFLNIDLSNGTVGTIGSSLVSHSVNDLGNGWYRVSLVATAIANGANGNMLTTLVTSTTATRLETWTAAGTETVFIWGAQLEQRSALTAYTPTTTQPITNYIPVLESASAGVARFDHSPTTFESLGLLVEEQRTNLAIRSENFESASWLGGSVSKTNNIIIAPDGALTAGKIAPNNTQSLGLGLNIFLQNITAAAGTYTYSVYAKKGEFNRVGLRVRDESTVANNFSVVFNLTDGTIATAAANAGTFTGATASSVSVGNGWYRFILTGTTTGATALRVQIAPLDSTATTGDGYSGIYIWGASLEQGSFSTSYIKTEASQVTRSADSASMTGANFSSWYRQDEGTVYAEAAPQTSNANSYILFDINDNTASNRIGMTKTATTGNAGFVVIVNAATQANINSGAWTSSGKFVGSYKTNDFACVLNGSGTATDNSGNIPVVTQANIGARADGGSRYNGHIRKLAFYQHRLSNTQLQALTS